MAILNKKNKNPVSDLPRPSFDLPRFPKLPRRETFEEYKPIIPDFSAIKSEVNKPQLQQLNIFEDEPKPEPQKVSQPKFEESPKDDKELFIKVEKYEHAMKILEDLKDSFKRTEDILQNLQTIKQHEDKEITNWTAQIQKLKNKIISVDSILFESKK